MFCHSRKCKILSIVLALLLVTTLINGWIYANRKSGFLYQKADLKTLYGSQASAAHEFTGYTSVLTQEEKAKLRQHLTNIGVDETLTTEEKITRISRWILERDQWAKTQANPTSARWEKENKYKIFTQFYEGNHKAGATQLQEIYTLLANLAAIPTRKIETSLISLRPPFKLETDPESIHSFSESFVREKKAWVHIDLSSGKLFTVDHQGHLQSTLDLYQVVNGEKSAAELVSQRYDATTRTIITVPFANANASEKTFLKKGTSLLYTAQNASDAILDRIKGYLFRPYQVIADQGDHLRHPYKIYFLNLLLILASLTLATVFMRWKEPAPAIPEAPTTPVPTQIEMGYAGKVGLVFIGLFMLETISFLIHLGLGFVADTRHGLMDKNSPSYKLYKEDGIDNPDAFLKELQNLYEDQVFFHPSRWYAAPPSIKANYHSTDARGFRNTLYPMKPETEKIAFFGGSTMYSSRGLEKDTIPALINGHLNQEKIQAINYGVGGYATSAELGTFLEVSRYPENSFKYAVFLDGDNEFSTYMTLSQNQSRSHFYDFMSFPWRTGLESGMKHELGLAIQKKKGGFPYAWTLANQLYGTVKTHYFLESVQRTTNEDPEFYARASATISSIYINNIKDIQAVATARWIRPVFILQPNMFERSNLSRMERDLLRHYQHWAVDFVRLGREAYQAIRNHKDRPTLPFYDLSKAFDTIHDQDFLYDYAHVTSVGNRVIAEKILDILKQQMPEAFFMKP